MKASDILAKIDHTLLSATATTQQIDTLCQEAIDCKTAAVCIPACYVSHAAEKYGSKLKIATVIGFPLGYDTTISKVIRRSRRGGHGTQHLRSEKRQR